MNNKHYPSEQYLNEVIVSPKFAANVPAEVVAVMAAELQERRKVEKKEAAAKFLAGVSAEDFNRRYPVGSMFRFYHSLTSPNFTLVTTRGAAHGVGECVAVPIVGKLFSVQVSHMQPHGDGNFSPAKGPAIGEPRLNTEEQPVPVVPEELLSAMEEVLRISDRDHEAWHKVRNGIAACRAVQPVSAPAFNVYERIYGPLRKCPGPDSIYSATPSVGEHVPHGICVHTGCLEFYCEFGHLHLEPVPYPGCHAHSLNGGKNDA